MLGKTLGAAFLLLVIVCGYWSWTHRSSSVQHMPEQHVLQGTATSTDSLEYTEHARYYDVVLVYPASTGLADATADYQARMYMETALKTLRDDFVSSVGELSADVLPSLSDGHTLMLSAEYKKYRGQQTVSYAFTIYEDTGGAHPNSYFKAFAFDQNGKIISIQDVVQSNDLSQLARLVSADVKAQIKQRLQTADITGSVFEEGFAPKESNFSNFVIDGDTLVILIPPYQVAAYVLGSFEVRIPISSLR